MTKGSCKGARGRVRAVCFLKRPRNPEIWTPLSSQVVLLPPAAAFGRCAGVKPPRPPTARGPLTSLVSALQWVLQPALEPGRPRLLFVASAQTRSAVATVHAYPQKDTQEQQI